MMNQNDYNGVPEHINDFPWNFITGEDLKSVKLTAEKREERKSRNGNTLATGEETLTNTAVFSLSYEKVRQHNANKGFHEVALVHPEFAARVLKKDIKDFTKEEKGMFFENKDNKSVIVLLNVRSHFSVLIVRINGRATLLDSLYVKRERLQLKAKTYRSLAILFGGNGEVAVRNQVQRQNGGTNCGIYAINFCFSFCDGKKYEYNPWNICEQRKTLRKQLHNLKMEFCGLDDGDEEEMNKIIMENDQYKDVDDEYPEEDASSGIVGEQSELGKVAECEKREITWRKRKIDETDEKENDNSAEKNTRTSYQRDI
ncbi:unnamed protein product [Caenorhabditis sp. 36 PRJEB53466]|nr:unnamed protein product [Caenorhabditis sp. 36 PRJEB53466]